MSLFPKICFIIFLGASFSSLNAQSNVVESESPIYQSLGIDQISLHISVKDADTKEILCFNLKALDSLHGGIVFKIDSNTYASVHPVILPIAGIYQLHFSSHGFQDTTIVVNLSKIEDYQLKKEILLLPRRTDVEITIRDIDKDEFMETDVLVRNRNRNEQIELEPEDAKDSKYIVRLREEDEYEVEVKNPEGLIFYTNNLIDPKTMKDKKLEVQVIRELKVNSKVRLYGITFASRSAELNQNAKNELDRVAELLSAYPTAKLEIAAHTDSLGTLQFNMDLSLKRASVVFDYLVEKGVKPQSLIKKGYGPTRPIAPNDTEEGRAKNRRFELIVISL